MTKVANPTDDVLTHLCHLLSLSRTGKVQGAVDSLVLTVLSIDPQVGSAGDANEVALALTTYFSVELPLAEVRSAIETHLRKGRLQRTTDGRLTLSPSAKADVEQRVEQAEQLERTVRREWLLELASTHPTLDPELVWHALQGYLGAVFRQNGALAVELLRPGTATPRETGGGLSVLLADALRESGLGNESEAASAVTTFFRSSTSARSRYISQLLDGTFTFLALSVSNATAELLRGQLPNTKLFLDTNVVLGILDLHENPMSEATLELLAFIKKHRLPFQLYFHERTLKELRDLIDAATYKLLATHASQALSAGVVLWSDRTSRLTGIERRYHALNAEHPLDPKVFLSKFDHIEELLADKGIKLYRQSPPDLDVTVKGEYIAEFEHFLAKRGRERPYLARDHDIVLWMSLQRQRQGASNALKTGALLLTNDNNLFDFDARFLRRKDQSQLATTVLPQQLIQVLRPLVGTASDFDSRFVEVFAAPEFRTAQSDYDETGSLVIQYLATYQDVSTETAVRVLSDEVLLSQLRPDEQTESEFRELIENAVFRDNSALLATVDEQQRRAERAEVDRQAQALAARTAEELAARASGEAEQLRSERAQAEQDAVKAEREASARAQALQEQLERERERADAAQDGLQTVKDRAARLRKRRFSAVAAGLAVMGTVLAVFGPSMIGWKAAIDSDKRLPISLLALVSWLGLCWVIHKPAHWSVVVPGVVVAALIALITLV